MDFFNSSKGCTPQASAERASKAHKTMASAQEQDILSIAKATLQACQNARIALAILLFSGFVRSDSALIKAMKAAGTTYHGLTK